MPAMASTTNHTALTGPKKAATRCVPRDWTANRAMRMTKVSGSTEDCSTGSATSRPSTAESTDSAGVMMALP